MNQLVSAKQLKGLAIQCLICTLAEGSPYTEKYFFQKKISKLGTSRIDFISPFSRETFSLHTEHTHYAASVGRIFLNSQSNVTQSTSAFQRHANLIFTLFLIYISVKSHFFFSLQLAATGQSEISTNSKSFKCNEDWKKSLSIRCLVTWSQYITVVTIILDPPVHQFQDQVSLLPSVITHINNGMKALEKNYHTVNPHMWQQKTRTLYTPNNTRQLVSLLASYTIEPSFSKIPNGYCKNVKRLYYKTAKTVL